jgi:hypothetical protein
MITFVKTALVAITFSGALFGSVFALDAQDRATPSNQEPTFLISERDLGNGLKVCFLSNGLQMRLNASQVCPYPLRAAALAVEQSAAASKPNLPGVGGSADRVEASNAVPANDAPQQQPQNQQSFPTSEVAKSANFTQQIQRGNIDQSSKSTTIATISNPVVQPSTPPVTATGVTSQVVANAVSSTQDSEPEDLIADRAIRRCERIGFKSGTDQFKACALEQIRILSGAPLN